MTSASTVRRFPQPAVHQQASQQSTFDADGIVPKIAAIYIFVLVARISELLAVTIGTGLYLLVLLAGAAICLQLARGETAIALTRSPGTLVVLFTTWMILLVPLSSWSGGSVMFLKDTWLKSLLAFFTVAAAASYFKSSRSLIIAAGLAGFWTAVQATVFGSESSDGRYQGLGSLAQANALSYQSIYVIPFLFYMMQQKKKWLVLIGTAGFLLAAASILRTGSRAGFIELSLVLSFIFFRLKGSRKAIFVLSALLVFALGLAAANEQALRRVKTLFGEKDASAEESKDGRLNLFWTAVRITKEHPVFGVGPGTFISAATLDRNSDSQPAWMDAHNAYAKVASETGLPGLAIWASTFFYTLYRLIGFFRLIRRRPEWADAANQTYLLITAFCMFLVNSWFDSNLSYSYYGLVLLGLSAAVFRAADREMQSGRNLAPATAFAGSTPRNVQAPAGMRKPAFIHQRTASGFSAQNPH